MLVMNGYAKSESVRNLRGSWDRAVSEVNIRYGSILEVMCARHGAQRSNRRENKINKRKSDFPCYLICLTLDCYEVAYLKPRLCLKYYIVTMGLAEIGCPSWRMTCVDNANFMLEKTNDGYINGVGQIEIHE